MRNKRNFITLKLRLALEKGSFYLYLPWSMKNSRVKVVFKNGKINLIQGEGLPRKGGYCYRMLLDPTKAKKFLHQKDLKIEKYTYQSWYFNVPVEYELIKVPPTNEILPLPKVGLLVPTYMAYSDERGYNVPFSTKVVEYSFSRSTNPSVFLLRINRSDSIFQSRRRDYKLNIPKIILTYDEILKVKRQNLKIPIHILVKNWKDHIQTISKHSSEAKLIELLAEKVYVEYKFSFMPDLTILSDDLKPLIPISITTTRSGSYSEVCNFAFCCEHILKQRGLMILPKIVKEGTLSSIYYPYIKKFIDLIFCDFKEDKEIKEVANSILNKINLKH